MIYKVPVILTPQPEGCFTVTSPLLPELITQGKTQEEALKRVPDAFQAVLELYEEFGRPLPKGLEPAIPGEEITLDALVAVP